MFLRTGGYQMGNANGVGGRSFKDTGKWYKNKMAPFDQRQFEGERSIREWADSLRRKSCNIWSRY